MYMKVGNILKYIDLVDTQGVYPEQQSGYTLDVCFHYTVHGRKATVPFVKFWR